MSLRGMLRYAHRKWQGQPETHAWKYDRLFCNLGPGDVVLDIGANVGHVTEKLARYGATVYAFEPHPLAFQELQRRVAGLDRVICHNQAVAAAPGTARLYMHENAGQDPLHWSTGSSLLEFKGNIDRENYVDVEAIDLNVFIRSLGKPIKLIKMDIEGAEIQVLNHLIDTNAIGLVQNTLVETHDHKIQELKQDTDELRLLVNANPHWGIDLGWI